MVMPLIVLGGIYSGMFTPTEAAAVACVYAVIVSVIYRGFSKETFFKSLRSSLNATSMIFFIVAAAIMFAGPLTYAEIPQNLTKFIIGMGFGKTGFIILATLLFLVLGCFIECLPILYLTIPLMYTPMQTLGVDLIHFCVITIISMQIAQVTPPFGVSLFTASQMWREPVDSVIWASLPFLAILICSLPLFIFVPWLSTWLPSIIFM
jgi:C4-dicarboxylate transporter DctM subunit